MGNFVSYSNASDLMTAIGQKFSTVTGGLTFRGTVTFANLPSTLTKAMTGYFYNVSDGFTTDARFIEGSGKVYPAGVDVAVANIGTDETPNMKFDVLGSFIDETAINNRITAVANNLADAFDANHTGGYAIDDVVMKDDVLYKFTSAHTEGNPWNASEVTEVTVESLVSAAEPASLTTTQVTALLALL